MLLLTYVLIQAIRFVGSDWHCVCAVTRILNGIVSHLSGLTSLRQKPSGGVSVIFQLPFRQTVVLNFALLISREPSQEAAGSAKTSDDTSRTFAPVQCPHPQRQVWPYPPSRAPGPWRCNESAARRLFLSAQSPKFHSVKLHSAWAWKATLAYRRRGARPAAPAAG